MNILLLFLLVRNPLLPSKCYSRRFPASAPRPQHRARRHERRIAALDPCTKARGSRSMSARRSGGVWKSTNVARRSSPGSSTSSPWQFDGAVTIDLRRIQKSSGSVRRIVMRNQRCPSATGSTGRTWWRQLDKNMGLRNCRAYVRSRSCRRQTNTVYACAPRRLWSDSDERGVLQDDDGGRRGPGTEGAEPCPTGCSMMSMIGAPRRFMPGVGFPAGGRRSARAADSATAPNASGNVKSTGRWRDVERAHVGGLVRPAAEARGASAVDCRAIQAGRRIRVPRSGCRRKRVVSLPRTAETCSMLDRSQNIAARPFYFANLIVGSARSGPRLQD